MSDAVVGGRYRLVERLASGGMGTVWKAWDERLQRTVAVKQLHVQPGLSKHDAGIAVERAMREARLTARLHHPNAVQVFDVVDDNGQPCLIMQYVPSTSLQNIVRDNGPRSPAEVARIGTQIAAALAAAHRVGIVHRDVKPGNVLIADDGTAKITDFGISHALDDVALTSTGMLTGTPAYLAPEVARGSDSSYASDVFSLGSTLFMAVEGTPPFGTDQNPMATLHRVASGDTLPPTRCGPLAPVLHEMMSADPTTRPDMVAVANTLAELPTARDGSADPTQVIAARTPLPVDQTRAMPIVRPRNDPMTGPPLARPLPPPLPPPSTRERRKSSAWVPSLAAAIIVVLGAIIAVVLINDSGDGNNVAATQQSSTRAAPASRPAPRTKVASSTHSSSSSAPSSSAKPSSKVSSSAASSPKPTGAPTASELAQAINDYYALVPGNTDAGWARLTTHYQDTVSQSRKNYNDYWASIASVGVSDSSGASPSTATVTLTYHFKDGRVTSDRTRFGLVRQGGVLKIDSSQVLDSQTR